MGYSYKIYKLTLPNGKAYVGMTMQKLNDRWESGKGYKHSPIFNKALSEVDWQDVKKEVLATTEDANTAEELEMFYIAKYNLTNPENGYNIDNGGNRKGTHSEATKRKIGERNKGKAVSKETREKLRQANLGKYGEKNAFYGRHHTEENKRKQSERMRANKYFYGKHHSEEFKRAKSIQMHEKYKDGKSPKCKIVQMYEAGELVKEFTSLTKAALNAGISKSLLCSIIKRQDERNGKTWRYKDA